MARWNEAYNYQEVIEVQVPKRIFNLKRRYEPGMGDLHVYYNGVLMTKQDMYFETNPYQIELTFDPGEGDQLIFEYQKLW